MPGETSKVLTLVFTDLADSTALKSERGDQAVDELITRHREHVSRLADECTGRVIDWAGDGCFLTFDTSSAGVMFALRLQQAHADEPDLPAVRIGIHLGEVTEKDGPDNTTYVKGLAVDVAARVQGLAKPGQVLMSSSVYNSAKQRMGVDTLGQPILWQLHGLYDLKGFDHPLEIGEAGIEGVSPLEAPGASEKANPVALSPRHEKIEVEVVPPPARRAWLVPALIAAVVMAGVAVAYWSGRSRTDDETPVDLSAPITSIAVLPLDNHSNDPEQQYFADGMTEAITAELAKIKSLKVISRTSAQHYRDTELSLPEVAAELNVDGLIEGSVVREGDEVRITVQLIDARTDAHVWSESYQDTIISVLKLQSEVALAIADTLRAELTPDERERIAEFREVDPEAYDVYLQAVYAMTDITPVGLFRVRQLFTRATELDPEFAEAWGGIAISNIELGVFSAGPPRKLFEAAREAAQHALSLAPTLGDAQVVLGLTELFLKQDWDSARTYCSTAEALDPNSFFVARNYGYFKLMQGDWKGAQEQADRVLEQKPDASFAVCDAATILIVTGRRQQGLQILESEVGKNPMNIQATVFLGLGRISVGEYEQAAAEFVRCQAMTGPVPALRAQLAYAHALAGRQDDARKELESLASSAHPEVLATSAYPLAYFVLGESDTAFEWLERGAETPTGPYFVMLRNTPFSDLWQRRPDLAPFADDPRYWRLIERLGFPPLPPEHPGYPHEQAWLAKKAAAEAANAPIKKIAVLPFDNMSSDTEQVYFVDGMTEALIAELAKIKSIKVISRTSVMQYKDTDKSMPEIARELGVDALVEGSVMKVGNDVRITAQLVHGITDEHLWADSYTNTLENVFKLQAEVALAITDEINAVVTPEERARIAVVESVNAEAYELYVQGRNVWSLRTDDGLRQAKRYFERALELDDRFALAHVGLADTYLMLWDYKYLLRDDASPRARQQIEQALAIDPNLGEAYTSLGLLELLSDWRWEEAEKAFLKGVDLSPGYATGHQWYAALLRERQRHEESLAAVQTAHELDPVSPIVSIWMAESLALAGRSDEAIELAKELYTLHPGLSRIRLGLFNILTSAGRYKDALFYFESPLVSDNNSTSYYENRAYLLAMTGDKVEARRLINEHTSRVDGRANWIMYTAAVFVALDERGKALSLIEQGYEIGDVGLREIHIWPLLRPLYDEPRFRAVVQKMNLPEPPNDITAETRSTRS